MKGLFGLPKGPGGCWRSAALASSSQMAGWWVQVVKEAMAATHAVVSIGLRYGMILFIVSEVMFFVACSGSSSRWRSSTMTDPLPIDDSAPLGDLAAQGGRGCAALRVAAGQHPDLLTSGPPSPGPPRHCRPANRREAKDRTAADDPAGGYCSPRSRPTVQPIRHPHLFTRRRPPTPALWIGLLHGHGFHGFTSSSHDSSYRLPDSADVRRVPHPSATRLLRPLPGIGTSWTVVWLFLFTFST